MLFTRCPHCDTIFRVTDEALAKAGGRVRCGRCANVFDATADLRESPDGSAVKRPADSPAAPASASSASASPASASSASTAPPSAGSAASAASAASAPAATPTAPPPSAATAVAPPPATPKADRGAKPAAPAAAGGAVTAKKAPEHARETGEKRAGGASDTNESRDARKPTPTAARATPPAKRAEGKAASATITPAEIDQVLARSDAAGAPDESELEKLRPRRRAASKWWRAAAAIAFVALAVQAVHYFRQDLVVKPVAGPLLVRAYGAFGVELRPRWRVEQYRIIDSAATATTDDSGTWKVRARFQNDGPLAQPYPLIHLELKNRWQETVRSRRFTPAEYLARELPLNRLMTPGETAQAALEILDPGPDVSGFELDVCIEVETNVISCGKDEPFL